VKLLAAVQFLRSGEVKMPIWNSCAYAMTCLVSCCHKMGEEDKPTMTH
jgi:hypothetical protein